MDEQYYIRSRGRVQGPFTPARLKELAKRGKFSRYHHISGDRITWERASAHPELFPDVGPPKLRKVQASGALNLTPEAEFSNEPVFDAEEVLDEPGDAADQEWYYSRNGEQVDQSVTLEQLRELSMAGHVTGEDYVWTPGMPNWVEASAALPDMFPSPGGFQDQGSPVSSFQIRESEPQATAPMAVASFVLGLLGATVFFFIGSILAIVFGHIALKQIAESENRLGGRGMALAGLILGYIVLTIAVIVGVCVLCISIIGMGG